MAPCRAARRRVGDSFLTPGRTASSAMRRGRRRARPRSVAAAISTSTRVTLVRAEGSAAAARRLRGLCLLALRVIRWWWLIRVFAKDRDSRVEQRCRGPADRSRSEEHQHRAHTFEAASKRGAYFSRRQPDPQPFGSGFRVLSHHDHSLDLLDDSMRPQRLGLAGVELTLATARSHVQNAVTSMSTANGAPASMRLVSQAGRTTHAVTFFRTARVLRPVATWCSVTRRHRNPTSWTHTFPSR